MENIFTITLNHNFSETIGNSLYVSLSNEDAILLNRDHVQIKVRFTDIDVMYYKANKEQKNLYKSLVFEYDGDDIVSEVAYMNATQLIITTDTITSGGGGSGDGKETLKLDLVYTNSNIFDTNNNCLWLSFDNDTLTTIRDFIDNHSHLNCQVKLKYDFNTVPTILETFDKYDQTFVSCFIDELHATLGSSITGGSEISVNSVAINFKPYATILDVFTGGVNSFFSMFLECYISLISDMFSGISIYLGTTITLLQTLFNKLNVEIYFEGVANA